MSNMTREQQKEQLNPYKDPVRKWDHDVWNDGFEHADDYPAEDIAVLKDQIESLQAALKCKDEIIKIKEKQIPEWHDLEKNPNDLPYRTDDYYCRTLRAYEVLSYIYGSGQFVDNKGKDVTGLMIAWAEKPEFKKK